MAARGRSRTTYRAGLSREQVFRTAVRLADESGISALTMRGLAQALEVEAMSLYHHVADKNEVLDGMVDTVVSEINTRLDATEASPATGAPPESGISPDGDGNWKAAVRHRILTAREVLLGHPWAPGVIETRSVMSPPVMRYYDSLMGQLRRGGLPVSLVHHAMHALGSRALGFSQELFAPGEGAGTDVAAIREGQLGREFPYVTEIAVIESGNHDRDSTIGWCDDQTEFEFGLDLLLDGLERLHNA